MSENTKNKEIETELVKETIDTTKNGVFESELKEMSYKSIEKTITEKLKEKTNEILIEKASQELADRKIEVETKKIDEVEITTEKVKVLDEYSLVSESIFSLLNLELSKKGITPFTINEQKEFLNILIEMAFQGKPPSAIIAMQGKGASLRLVIWFFRSVALRILQFIAKRAQKKVDVE